QALRRKRTAGFDVSSGGDQFVEPTGDFLAGDSRNISSEEVVCGVVVKNRGNRSTASRRRAGEQNRFLAFPGRCFGQRHTTRSGGGGDPEPDDSHGRRAAALSRDCGRPGTRRSTVLLRG